MMVIIQQAFLIGKILFEFMIFKNLDSTEGWINVQETQTSQTGVNPYIVATGGTPCSGAIVCTNYKVHGDLRFTVVIVDPILIWLMLWPL